jgi:serine protease
MATPHVAGVAAIYLAKTPTASPDKVRQAVLSVAAVGKISDTRGTPNLLLQVKSKQKK